MQSFAYNALKKHFSKIATCRPGKLFQLIHLVIVVFYFLFNGS